MIQSANDTYTFRLGRRSYRRIGLLGWLVLNGCLLCAVVAVLASIWFLPTYSHGFTLYLKWQDALVGLCWYVSLISLLACVLVLRFLSALRTGYREGMLTLVGNTALIVRDLSAGNLSNIFGMLSTTLLCFLVAVVGLLPGGLLGWTLHITHPILAVLATVIVIILSVAGLVVTLVAALFAIISCLGSISACRDMAEPQTYPLTSQTTLIIEGFVLSIISSDKPESMIDLDLLHTKALDDLLNLLRKYRIDTQGMWNPPLDEE